MDIPYTAATVGAVLRIMQLVFMISTGTHRGKNWTCHVFVPLQVLV